MKMYVIDGGKMYLDESALVEGIHGASSCNQNPAASWVDIPVTSFLIESNDGYVLYDTGCNAVHGNIPPDVDVPSPFVYTPEQLLPARLSQLGVDPADIRFVVMSHLHSDHAGYLYMFKHARVIASDNEFTQAMRLYGLRQLRGPYMYENFDAFLDARLDWLLLPDGEREYKLCDGVTAVSFGPGHAFGMTGLLVELPNSGSFLMCADALYRSENLGPPVRIPGLIYDSIGYVNTANFIMKYAKEKGAKIIFGHDKVQFKSLITSDRGFYD